MPTAHIGARIPSDLATAMAIMARERGTSVSAETRAALERHVGDWAASEDGDPAGQGEVAGSTPKQAASVGTG